MLFDRISVLLALTHLASSKQPTAPEPIPAPLRKLPWGQLNFLHTTDTHGWLAGHLAEPQYSADWGDYISFAHHLRQRADADGSDLIVVDTGDRVEGTGLYDASQPKGKYTPDILKHQHIDIITSGNHELYKANTSDHEYEETVPNFKNSYIASNINIRDPANTTNFIPLAPRFRKFTTPNQGIRILAFGFLYNFQGNANNTLVQKVEDTVQEQWFKDAVREKDVDLYVVAGHVPVRDTPEFDAVYKAIRDVQWDTPVVFFGGHTHIRDFRRWEKEAVGIESGRYAETVGFLSVDGLNSEGKKKHGVGFDVKASPKFERLYIDNNLYSLHHHSGQNESTFATELGRNVSSQINEDRKILHLDHTFGCAPHDFWLNRAPYPSQDSLLTLLEEKILPDAFTTSASNKTPSIVMTNSGALRFDVFKGPFTIDTTYLICPFTSGFREITNVPYRAAVQVLQLLNDAGPIPLRDLLSFVEGEEGWGRHRLEDLVPPLAPVRSNELLQTLPQSVESRFMNQGQQVPLPKDDDNNDDHEPKLPGYTTTDDAGKDGDDTIHKPIKFYSVPNCVATNIGFSPDSDDDEEMPETLDIVYNEFIQDWVLLALRYLGVDYGEENTRVALEGRTLTGVIEGWVAGHWECEEEGLVG